MESASQNNAWMESYLDAWLSGGLSNEYTSGAKGGAAQEVPVDDADLYSQYYLHQIMSSTEDSLVSAWRKSQVRTTCEVPGSVASAHASQEWCLYSSRWHASAPRLARPRAPRQIVLSKNLSGHPTDRNRHSFTLECAAVAPSSS